MPYAEVQLNGSADWRLGLDMYVVSQDGAGNYSTYWYGVYLQNPTNHSAWFSNQAPWSTSMGTSGTFNIPYSGHSNGTRLLYSNYINVGHDSEGWRPGFANYASVDTPNSFIGDGTVELWTDAPRIAKRPAKPGNPTFSLQTPTSVRITAASVPDNRGSAINAWLFRRRDTVNGPYVDYTNAGHIHDITGLEPGKTYYWQLFARNGASYDNGGYSDGTDQVALTQPAGVYVSDGTKWVATAPRVSDGAAWSIPVPVISDGDSWEAPVPI